jgi:hypothetical protein
MFIILALTKHKFLKLNNFNKEKTQFGHILNQLAAYPSKIEQSLLLIAQTFRKLKGEWRTGQQFTRLYKCTCGYLYWIGDCGRAWVIGTCPKCGKKIGGEKHVLITDATEEEDTPEENNQGEIVDMAENRGTKN